MDIQYLYTKNLKKNLKTKQKVSLSKEYKHIIKYHLFISKMNKLCELLPDFIFCFYIVIFDKFMNSYGKIFFLQVLLEDYNGVLGHAQGQDTFDQKNLDI